MTKPKVTITCAICGTQFDVFPSYATQYSTCSPACKGLYMKQRQIAYRGSANNRTTTCAHCGIAIERKPSQIAKYPASYCSRACKKLGQVGKPQLGRQKRDQYPCETCGKLVTRTPSTALKHVFCSRACADPSTLIPAGEKHPLWRGGNSDPYSPGFTKALKQSIKDRDGYQCRICYRNASETRLTIHHVDLSKTNHDPDNLLTLCDRCHQQVHLGALAL